MSKRAFMDQHYIEDAEERYISSIYQLRDLEERLKEEPGLIAAITEQKRNVMRNEAQCRRLMHGY